MNFDEFKKVIPELLKCKETQFRHDSTLSLLFYKKDNYWIQRIPNIYYGYIILENGIIVPSYPHLNNYKEERLSTNTGYIEEKENGTNIGLAKINNVEYIRTRSIPNSKDFPITIFNSEELNRISDVNINKKIKEIRGYIMNKYPHYYINVGEYDFVGLKTQVVVDDILGKKKQKIFESYPNYMFFFELVGDINPIILEGTAEYGMYEFDRDLILIDILNINENSFICREEKEIIAKKMDLNLVKKIMEFTSQKGIIDAIDVIKINADINKLEGYVLKFKDTRIKIKSDMVLSSARRSIAIMKGYIYPDDLNEYMSKVITIDALKHPDKFDELINEVSMEAKTDYPDEIVDKHKKDIMKKVSTQMAIFLADDIMKEQKWRNKHEMFSHMNQEIPKRFKPLSQYMDYELELITGDKKLKNRLRKNRTDIFKRVAKFCMKEMDK